MWQLNNTRLGCAAGALGVGGAALELAIDYANARTQFGTPISKHQMIQAQIVEMAVEQEAARMLVYRAAWLKDNGMPNQFETSVAKLQALEAAVHAAERMHEDIRILRGFPPSIRPNGCIGTPSRCRSWRAPPTCRSSSSPVLPAGTPRTAEGVRLQPGKLSWGRDLALPRRPARPALPR